MIPASALPPDALKIISFNLRRDPKFGKKNRWEHRLKLAIPLIENSGAAIIGVQELLPHMRDDLAGLLSGYSFLGAGRYQGKRPKNDEHSELLIKNELARVVDAKTFWLSKHPERPASRAYYSVFPRVCTMAEIELKRDGSHIRVFNTHFDHICWQARSLGARVILRTIAQLDALYPLPTIVMGDFNAKRSSRPVRIFSHAQLKGMRFKNANLSSGNSLHRFKGGTNPQKSPIDYIFVSDDFEVLDSYLYTDSFDGRYPSDHYPLVAVLRQR